MTLKRVAVVSLLLTGFALAQVSVTVLTPTANSSGPSPINVTASAVTSTANASVVSMEIFVDGTRVYFQWGDSFPSAFLWMRPGWHNVGVQGTDGAGVTGSQTVRVKSTSASGTVYNIDDMATYSSSDKSGWQSCTDCTGGGGGATASTSLSTTYQNDGSGREFSLIPGAAYSNAYWYKFLGGSKDASHFIYDTWVWIDHPEYSQALELDVNQSFNKQRWVFGTQCNFKDAPPLGGFWNVWDGSNGGRWVATDVACSASDFGTPGSPVAQHIVWQVNRSGVYVQYVSLTINGVQHSINRQLGNQPLWTGADIDVSVQLDGDSAQHPYNVWIDSTSLKAW